MKPTDLTRELREIGCTVKENEPMSTHTSFKIGGAADLFVTVSDREAAAAVLRLCMQENVPLMVVGNGSNLLVSDAGIDGVVMRPEAEEHAITINGTSLTATAGVSLKKVCMAACEAGLSGLEFAYGIPGTVGGGVYMNAGAYGGELSDTVVSVTILERDGSVRELSASEMKFGYRHSVLMEQPWMVWAVTFELKAGDAVAIRAQMEQHMAARKEKQPLEYPSGGSFFKRPTGHFAGALIEQSGLKGFTVGGAQVSEKHAGFVINRGGATCEDVMTLCHAVQEKVMQTFGVQLEREVQRIGR